MSAEFKPDESFFESDSDIEDNFRRDAPELKYDLEDLQAIQAQLGGNFAKDELLLYIMAHSSAVDPSVKGQLVPNIKKLAAKSNQLVNMGLDQGMLIRKGDEKEQDEAVDRKIKKRKQKKLEIEDSK